MIPVSLLLLTEIEHNRRIMLQNNFKNSQILLDNETRCEYTPNMIQRHLDQIDQLTGE